MSDRSRAGETHSLRELIGTVRAAETAATPGPWFVRDAQDPYTVGAGYVSSVDGDEEDGTDGWDVPSAVLAVTWVQNWMPNIALSPKCAADAAFIVAARSAAPTFLDVLRSPSRRGRQVDADLAVRLTAMRAAESAASPGPWFQHWIESAPCDPAEWVKTQVWERADHVVAVTWLSSDDAKERALLVTTSPKPPNEPAPAKWGTQWGVVTPNYNNRTFIALSRTVVPMMCDAVERLLDDDAGLCGS